MNHTKQNPDTEFADDVETVEPKLYNVFLLNDDYTPMDFVIQILKVFFGHNDSSANKIMLNVHKQGRGLCGTYSFEVAETKSYQANLFSKQNQHPLKSIIEEES